MSTKVKKEVVTEDDLKSLEAFQWVNNEKFIKHWKWWRLYEHLMKYYVKESDHTSDKDKLKSTSVPRTSIFYDESDKGEVNLLTWQCEVKCLMIEGMYSEWN